MCNTWSLFNLARFVTLNAWMNVWIKSWACMVASIWAFHHAWLSCKNKCKFNWNSEEILKGLMKRATRFGLSLMKPYYGVCLVSWWGLLKSDVDLSWSWVWIANHDHEKTYIILPYNPWPHVSNGVCHISNFKTCILSLKVWDRSWDAPVIRGAQIKILLLSKLPHVPSQLLTIDGIYILSACLVWSQCKTCPFCD